MSSINIFDSNPAGLVFFWSIKNFHLCTSNSKLFLKSHNVQARYNRYKEKCQWQLELRKHEDSLGLYLFIHQSKAPVIIQFIMSILTSSGWITVMSSSEMKIDSSCKGHGTKNLIPWKKIFENNDVYLPNKCFTISCHVWDIKCEIPPQQIFMPSCMRNEKCFILHCVQKFESLKYSDFVNFPVEVAPKSFFNGTLNHEKEVCHVSIQTDEQTGNENLCDQNFLRRLVDNKPSYVTLRTATKDFAVYKDLICSSSKVFSNMLSRNRRAQNKNILEIKDIDVNTLDLLLQFVHLNPLDNLEWEATVKLYQAADKYQIEKLKNECLFLLKNQLDTENFCNLLTLSDMYQDNTLKQVVKNYFCKNSKLILKSTSWCDFLLRKTELAQEMLLALAEEL